MEGDESLQEALIYELDPEKIINERRKKH